MDKFTLDNVKGKVADLAQTGLAKSSQVTEMAKLQINNASENETLKKIYLELGKYYYEEFCDNPHPAVAEACEKIVEAKKNIVANNLRIKELRNPDIILSEDKMPSDAVTVEAEVFSESFDVEE